MKFMKAKSIKGNNAKKYIAVILLLLIQYGICAQKTALLAKTLIDGTGKIISNPAVIIDSNKISSNCSAI